MINIHLNEMGVFQSEFGFPVTRHETNYLNANLELAKKGALSPMRLGGWLRATRDDVRTAFKLVPNIKHLNLSISTSDQMIIHKFKGKLDHHSVIKEMAEAVKEALKCQAESVGVNAEDASRTRMDYLIEFSLAAKEAGAHRIRYCDTLGCDTPFSIYDRIKTLAEAVKMPIEIHGHNDLGMVAATSVAGAKAAVDCGQDAYINTCVNGMGERAGNADLVSVILAIKFGSGMQDYSLDEKINLKTAWKICKYASYAFGVPIPINQPGVGANAFAHDFEELGRGEPEIIETGRKITAGEYSGIKGFRNVYEKLELEFRDEEEATKVLELVRYANVHNQKPLVDEELKFIAKYPDIARKIFTMSP
jgi:homocitrate synthase NifV